MMDPWLASVYGTGGAEDIEKTAQHHLLQKLAEEEGVDLSGLSDEDLDALAAEVSGEEGQEASDGYAEQEPSDMYEAAAEQELLAKEASAKFEEADFLGRVMAHSYTQELEKIAKTKMKQLGPKDNAGGSGLRAKATGFAHRAGSAIGGAAKRVGWEARHQAGRVARHVGRHGKAYGAAGLAASAAAGAYAGSKKKTASAFEKLAEMQAAEMLSAVGVDPATGQEQGQAQQPQQPQQAQRPQMQGGLARPQMQQAQQPQQGQQGQVDPAQFAQSGQFQEMLNHRALEMLSELGYDPDEIVAALSQQGQQGGGQPGAQFQR